MDRKRGHSSVYCRCDPRGVWALKSCRCRQSYFLNGIGNTFHSSVFPRWSNIRKQHGVRSRRVKPCACMIDFDGQIALPSQTQCHVDNTNGGSFQSEFKNDNLSTIFSNRMLTNTYVNNAAQQWNGSSVLLFHCLP